MRHLLFLSPSLLFACYSETSTKVFNSIPEVQITSHPNQVEFNELEEQIFTAQVSDTNHANEDLEVSWLLDEEIICDWETPQPGGLSDCVILFPSDIERVSVQVRDPVGAASTDTIEVKVIPSTPPQVDLLSPLAEQRYYSNALIQFEVQLSDIDEPAENLLLDWKSSIEGDLELEGTIDTNGLFTAARYLSEGEHYLDLTVQDSAGKSTAVSQIIKVGPENNTPTCNITDPESNIGFASGETVVFQAVVSDIELTPEELLISWTSDRDGELGESTADSTGHTNFSSSELSIGTHSVTLSVVDDAGAVCSENILVQIGTAPNIQLASPGNGDNIRENTGILFEGTILDDEDQSDEIAVSWISDIDGEFSTQGADSNGNFSFSTTLSPGNHNISLKATDPIGLFSVTSFSVFVNQLPSSPQISISPNPAKTGDDLLAQASGSVDPEGNTVSYIYEWYQNGIPFSNTSTTISNADTTKGDLWTLRVTPFDAIHEGAYAETSITIENTAPDASSLTITPNVASNYDTISCGAIVSDIDGDTYTEQYTWTNMTSGQVLASGSSIDLSLYSNAPGDDIQCSLTVDDGTDSTTVQTDISLLNNPPQISSVSISPTGAYVDDTLTCTVSASDPDNESITTTYEWINRTSGLPLGSNDTLILTPIHSNPEDEIVCRATVTDAASESDTQESAIVLINREPTIQSVNFSPADFKMGTTIDCLVTSEDPDSDTLSTSYEWRNETTGTVIGNLPSLALDFSIGTGADEISCNVVVSDPYGGTHTMSNSGIISRTLPEFIADASISPSEVNSNSAVTCAATAIDPDGTPITMVYEWTNNTTSTLLGNGDTIQLSPFEVQPNDEIQCVATATDANGEVDTSTVVTDVVNTPPALSNVLISPSGSVLNTDSLLCSVDVFDADAESPTPNYIWYNGSAAIGIGQSITLDPSVAMPGDEIICLAEASDNYGGSNSIETSITIDNQTPILSSISLSPTTAYNDTLLSCTATYTEPDGEAVYAEYQWENTSSGSIIGSQDSLQLDSSMAHSLDAIACHVTITDDFGSSVAGSETVLLGNRSPDTPIVELSPSPAYTDSEIECNVTVSDPDNDSLTYSYTWERNGQSISNIASTLTGNFIANDAIACHATVSDGSFSTNGSGSIGITNKSPDINSLGFDINELYTDDTLTAISSVSDADGDTTYIEYDWRVNGTLVQTGTQDTLDGTQYFEKGDSIEVMIRTWDDYNPVNTQTETIECLNTKPQGLAISLSRETALGEDELECLISSPASDPDGDPISYLFEWTVDGTPFTGATDSSTGSLIDPSAIGLDETWICAVTPYDNDEYGTTLQSSSLIVPQWTGIREFSTCGKTGSEGPSQSDCDSLYSGSTLESEIVVDNGVQKWITPRSGIYSIEVMGAAGGNSNGGIGGAGSYMSGEFRIDVGTEIYIIVGQEGDNGGSTGGAGGGGGTFVLEADGTPLIIAGGGGGAASYQSYVVDGLDAPLTESGADGNSDDHQMGSIGGSNGLGGGGSIGSGGAGLLGDGGGSFPGLSYANGLVGGSATTFGGFGGGAGSNPSHGPGGGGGYSGGGAGEFIHYYGSAGGGGSYNSGQNQNNQSGVGEQEGRVFINFIE